MYLVASLWNPPVHWPKCLEEVDLRLVFFLLVVRIDKTVVTCPRPTPLGSWSWKKSSYSESQARPEKLLKSTPRCTSLFCTLPEAYTTRQEALLTSSTPGGTGHETRQNSHFAGRSSNSRSGPPKATAVCTALLR